MGINSIEALRGNRLMLRAVGLTEKELSILGVATPESNRQKIPIHRKNSGGVIVHGYSSKGSGLPGLK